MPWFARQRAGNGPIESARGQVFAAGPAHPLRSLKTGIPVFNLARRDVPVLSLHEHFRRLSINRKYATSGLLPALFSGRTLLDRLGYIYHDDRGRFRMSRGKTNLLLNIALGMIGFILLLICVAYIGA